MAANIDAVTAPKPETPAQTGAWWWRAFRAVAWPTRSSALSAAEVVLAVGVVLLDLLIPYLVLLANGWRVAQALASDDTPPGRRAASQGRRLDGQDAAIGVVLTTLDAMHLSVLRYRYRTLSASVLAHGFNNTMGLTTFFLGADLRPVVNERH